MLYGREWLAPQRILEPDAVRRLTHVAGSVWRLPQTRGCGLREPVPKWEGSPQLPRGTKGSWRGG